MKELDCQMLKYFISPSGKSEYQYNKMKFITKNLQLDKNKNTLTGPANCKKTTRHHAS